MFFVLHRDMPGYQAAQTNREWRRTTIVRPELDPKSRRSLPSIAMPAHAPKRTLSIGPRSPPQSALSRRDQDRRGDRRGG